MAVPAEPIRLLGTIQVDERIRVNGNDFTVIDITLDAEGCEQWTLARAGSSCLKTHLNERRIQ